MRWLFTIPVSLFCCFVVPVAIYKVFGRRYKINFKLLKVMRNVFVFASTIFNTALLLVDSGRGLVQVFWKNNQDSAIEISELGALMFEVLPYLFFVLLVSVACFHLGRRVGQWKVFMPDKTFGECLEYLAEKKGGVKHETVVSV